MISRIKQVKSILLVILLAMVSISAYAQQGKNTVIGTVKDKSGEPIIGASVREKGTSNGTATDLNGNYSLDVSGKGTLLVTFTGMKSKEVSVNGKSKIDVVLDDNDQTLNEVVVIGYGSVKKKDLTGSVSSVSGETLQKVPVSSVAEAMTGRLAGVQITTTDGSPDAEMIIRVRGGGSITGDNSPLYIVDGFPVSSISDVAPSDIESIDVLKDASSTAIYGARGANGVVIITTKSAKGGRTQISYNGFMQSKSISKRLGCLGTYDYVMSNYEQALLSGTSALNTFQTAFGDYDDFYLYKSVKAHDWQKDMFGSNVLSQQHNVSITGGNDKTKFSLSGTYDYNGGLMKNNNYGRYNFNFKLSHQLFSNLLFTANARIIDTKVMGSGTSGGTYKIRSSQAITSMATQGLESFVDPSTMDPDEYEQWQRATMSLTAQSNQYWKKNLSRTFNFSGSLDWTMIKNLVLHAEGTYEYGFNDTRDWWGATTTNASYVGGLPLADWTKENTRSMREACYLNYKLKLKEDNQFNIMVGQELVDNKEDRTYMYATMFSTDLTPDQVFANFGLAGGSTYQMSSYVNPDNKLESFYGRFGYNYKDKYLLTFTFRTDGSSKFMKGKQWGYFPAAAAAWRINEEPWMARTRNWLSNLKLRMSWGEVGNNRISSTLYQTTYSINTSKTYGIGDLANNYYSPSNSQMPNPHLKWETTITRNLGLDFGLFNEKLNGTVEYYWDTAKDLLITRSIVAPGYTSTVQNTAQTSNKGVEITLNGSLVRRRNFQLDANFNIGFNHNSVDKIANGQSSLSFNSGWAGTDSKGQDDYRIIKGQPVGIVYGWVADGYYKTTDFDYNASTQTYTPKTGVPTCGLYGGSLGNAYPGIMKLKDLNKDGVVDSNDRQVIGKTSPKFTGGFGFDGILFRDFDFSMMFSFVYGNKIYNANKIASAQDYRTTYTNLLSFMSLNNRYTYFDQSTGQRVYDPTLLAQMNEGTGTTKAKQYWSPWTFGNAVVMPTSWAIEDGSFLRMQTLTVGYTLPATLTRRFGCSRLRFYCTANNLFCLTGYSGYDPEVSTAVRNGSYSVLTPGVDYSSYPKSLSITFGANITF